MIVSEYNLQHKLNHIDSLDEYDILELYEYVCQHNKWHIEDSIADYISHNCTVWLCQYLDLPCDEGTRYQPSCILPIVKYNSYQSIEYQK